MNTQPGLSLGLTLLVGALSGAGGGVLSAILTSVLAEGRFGREKWWELASQAYSEIAKDLLEQKLFTAEIMRRMYPDEAPGPGDWVPTDEQRAPAEAAAAAIDRRIAEGHLLLSKTAITLLEKYQAELRELRHSSDRGDLFYQGYDMYVQNYHRSFIEQARIDLRLRGWWLLSLSRSTLPLRRRVGRQWRKLWA